MKTAVYTTIYPDVIMFLPDFFSSLAKQNDKDFELFCCLDGIEEAEVSQFVSQEIVVNFFIPQEGSPSSIRQECWKYIIKVGYGIIVMVDADDILRPSRVKNAKLSLEKADIDVCGLQTVDGDLNEMPFKILPNPSEDIKGYIVSENDIGLSNTCFRTDFLDKVLPAPKEIIMLDWFLAMRAVEEGGRISKRSDLDMLYRQYDNNVANFIPPYSSESILLQTGKVISFYKSIIPYLSKLRPLVKKRLDEVQSVLARIVLNFNHGLKIL